MAEEASWVGAIVAVEGPKAIVSTQLRLLPSSPQILILPSLKNYIPKPTSFLNVFDAVTYIRQVNTALKRRHREAQEFLENNTSTTAGSKRLVFLDGGAASAQALCLQALMEHETAGDRAAAEATLCRLVHRGLAGLTQAGQERKSSDPFSYGGGIQDDESSDPSTRAMRAADALDRQTANLQTSNELDLTIRSHSRSSSLPLYGYSDTASGEPAPFLVFGSSTSDPATPIQRPLEPATLETPRFSIVKYDQHVSMPSVFGFNDYPTRNSFASITEGAVTPQTSAGHRRMESDAISPMSDAFSIGSFGKVEYGRASLLDVRKSAAARGDLSAPLQTLSLDTALQDRKPSEETITQKTAYSHQDNPEKQSREGEVLESADGATELTRAKSTTQRPRTITVKRSRPCVKLQPVPSPKKRRWQEGQTTFIDDESELMSAKPDEAVYEPVFPQQEDLVLYLRSERSPEPLLVSALNTMREEARRKSLYLSSSSKCSTASTESLKSLAQSDKGTVALTSPKTSSPTQEAEQLTPKTVNIETAPSISSADDYDPFAYINPVFGQVETDKQAKPIVTILRPPTPARTPSPPPARSKDKNDAAGFEAAVAGVETDIISDPDSGIHEIEVKPSQPPIVVQNLIRSVLSRYYPAKSDDYTQFLSNEGLWHPIFRTHDTSSNADVDENQLKQILAVGLQNGVKREYSARVIAQIEKFGTEPTGATRCTRLDFRYLLANTMQAFLSHPLAGQAKGNPFKHPNLLATLMLPHLETYLSMHSDIRFLILEYSTEHLPTVIAIQKLVGVDLVKIAQIVDAKSRERLPFRKVRDDAMSIASTYASSVYSQASSSSGSRHNQAASSPSTGVNTAKANFLLTSSASDKEVAEFVAAVWNLPVLDRRPQTAPAAENWQTQNQGAAQVPLPPTPPKQQEQAEMKTPMQQKPAAGGQRRGNKPAPLRVSTLSAFPKATGPQSPLSPTSNIMSVLPPPSPSPSTNNFARRTWESSSTNATTTTESGADGRSVPISAVDSSGSNRLLHGHVRTSTANTAVSVETIRAGNAPHIALMAPPSPNPTKLFDSLSGGAGGDDGSSVPRYLGAPSLADSLRRNSPAGYDNDGASSIMTFDPAEESDYDQEERRLMPIFGKKRPVSKASSKKALKVLGMTV